MPTKCPINGNHCDIETESVKAYNKRHYEEQCFEAHYRKDVGRLMVAAKQAIEILQFKLSIGNVTIYEIAKEATIDLLQTCLETMSSYEESDDPVANGWVGKNGQP